MTYTITTTQRVQGDSRSMETHTTVATLDEARETVVRQIESRADAQERGWTQVWHDAREDAYEISRTGDAIGPLPDGTVIEVRHDSR